MQELSCARNLMEAKNATLQRAKELIRKVFSSVRCKGKGEEHCAVNADGNGSLAMADIKGKQDRVQQRARTEGSSRAKERAWNASKKVD
jgi:hypothetical protein